MIRAHETPTTLTLVVDGPATIAESPAVSTTAKEAIGRGARTLRLDLRDCTSIDSTFSGTLLSLERLLTGVGGTLTLVSPSAKVRDLLEKMGLEDFYAIELAARPDAKGTEVPLTRPTAERLGRMVLAAHDELARVPGPAGTTFRTVVEEMRRDESQGSQGPLPDGSTPRRPAPTVH